MGVAYHEVLDWRFQQLQLVCRMLVVYPDAEPMILPDLTTLLGGGGWGGDSPVMNPYMARERERGLDRCPRIQLTGSRFPKRRFRKVDLPMPLGPTIATESMIIVIGLVIFYAQYHAQSRSLPLDSMLIPKSRFSKRVGWSWYLKVISVQQKNQTPTEDFQHNRDTTV